MSFKLKEYWSKMTEQTERVRLNSKLTLRKSVVTIFIISSISANATAIAAENINDKTIYHVYDGDLYIGAVSDKTKVDKQIQEKILEIEKHYKNHDFDYNTDELVIKPQRSFQNAEVNEEEVLSYLNSKYELDVNAVALKINGKIIAYLEDEKKLEKVLQMVKFNYVSDQEPEKLEHSSNLDASRIVDVKISKNVTVSMESVAPEKVMTVDETVQLLQKGSVSEEKYTVQKGDVLSTIAAKHGLKLKELLDLNPKVNEDTPLQIGDELVVTVNQPYLDVIVQKEVRATEPVPYETKYIEDDAMYKGESKVVENGSDGERKRIYKVSEKNGKQVSKEVVQETIVKEPVTEVIRIGTKEIPSKGTGELIWPTKGGYISSKQGYRWGKMHKGIDIARPSDRSILAADTGTVVFAGEDGGYGNKVVIDHNNGMRTLYAHLSSIDVSVGQTVQKGSKIGIMGSTGNSTGIHLHFEVYQNNKLQNPLNYF